MDYAPNGSRCPGGHPICKFSSRTRALLTGFGVVRFVSVLAIAQSTILLLMLLLVCSNATLARGQSQDIGWETRPRLVADVELVPRTRIQAWGELQHGVNFSFQRWRTGFLLLRRMKPIVKAHRQDIDADKEHHLVFGAGYEYLHTIQNGSLKVENRIIAQVTPNYIIPGEFLITDRNRAEFRWVNGAYDFRYRNKLMLQRPLEVHNFTFTPYGSGELYHDRNHQSWNQNQYGGGIQFPYKRLLMLDTYLLHQNCTSCSQHSINMLGATLNLYFRRAK